jgi:hypothetical protein
MNYVDPLSAGGRVDLHFFEAIIMINLPPQVFSAKNL